MTNFYPYYINTGLFEGFNPTLGWFLPTLDAQYVGCRMYDAIMAEEKEVYIREIIWWLKFIVMALPLFVKNKVCNLLIGEGMEHFVGRANALSSQSNSSEKKKN